jgi:hypothetical protein
MSYGRDRSRLRRNKARVREVLWRDWDPIGVNSADCPKDEYDQYVDKVYVMLMVERRSAEEVEAYLDEVATQLMALGMPTRLHNLYPMQPRFSFGSVPSSTLSQVSPCSHLAPGDKQIGAR